MPFVFSLCLSVCLSVLLDVCLSVCLLMYCVYATGPVYKVFGICPITGNREIERYVLDLQVQDYARDKELHAERGFK